MTAAFQTIILPNRLKAAPGLESSSQAFGQHGANELMYLVGLYCMVSMTLNGFAVPEDA